MAVGSYSPYHVNAELYDFSTGDWKIVQDYPFSGSILNAVYQFDMVYVPQLSAYYVIGGTDGWNRLARIAMLRNGAWQDAGQLNTARDVSCCWLFCYKIINSILSTIELNG